MSDANPLAKTVKLTLACGHTFLWTHEVAAPYCTYCKRIRRVVACGPIPDQKQTIGGKG